VYLQAGRLNPQVLAVMGTGEHPTSKSNSGGEGVNDVFDFGQGSAALEFAPDFAVAIGEASKTLALHYREIFHRGVRLLLFANGKVAHRLDRGCFVRRLLLLLYFNLHKILRAAAQSSQGSSNRL